MTDRTGLALRYVLGAIGGLFTYYIVGWVMRRIARRELERRRLQRVAREWLRVAADDYHRAFEQFCNDETEQHKQNLFAALAEFHRAVDEWEAVGGRSADLPQLTRQRSTPKSSSRK